MSDADVLAKAVGEQRILISNDKDFGESVYRDAQAHCGVVLLRLDNERAASKLAVWQRLLDSGTSLENHFVVVSETRIRSSPA